ncbi:MAG: murein L,D-transpeptidase YafK [Planktomarina sp.]|jgi:murein L,D-transpeptidase YafK|tara:strand:- start:441 stop:926 length:486 start_codon:yes stop_codon:yes gene_type:complete
MGLFKYITMICFALTLGSCSSFDRRSLPKATQIQVFKAEHRMVLLNENTIIKEYKFRLGFAPIGHKQFQGDGKTPEGQYYINRKNPNSRYYLSVGISYPNAADRAAANGKDPGGDIFIHGTPRIFQFMFKDWTWGCIAVSNRDIEEIYAMVDIGTTIRIFP